MALPPTPPAPPPPPPAAPAATAAAPDPELGLGRRTGIGGYGEGQAFVGTSAGDVQARLPHLGFYLGHRFSDWLRVYTETEVEDGARIGVDQAYVDVTPDPHAGVRAGVVLVPVGLTNVLHEPPTYLTVDRPLTDQIIIPSTWRELGVEVHGDLGLGAHYQAAALSGLDPTGLSATAPLVAARGDGRAAPVHDPAFAGRLDFAGPYGLDLGAGGYLGWANGGHPELGGVRVAVAEADARFVYQGFDARAEYAHLFIIDSYRVNDYLGLTGDQAIPARGYGYYVQAGYDVLRLVAPELAPQQLLVFAGFEEVNPRSRMSPYNYNQPSITGPNQSAPNAPSEPKPFVRAGVTWRPHPQLALKMDVQIALHEPVLAPAPTSPVAGAPGVQQPLPADTVDVARGESRLGLAAAFMF
jgi:hypothetical protein